MGKTTTGKKRGVQRGVAKHKIGSRPVKENGDEQLLFGLREAVYFSMARKCFEFFLHSCATIYLTPFTRTADGQYVPRGRKGMVMHYTVWLVKCILFLHKTLGLGTLLLYDNEFNIETIMCAAHFILYFISFSISLVMLVKPKETMDLLNSWPLILSCLKQPGKPEPTQFDDLSEAFKLIALLIMTQGAAVGGAIVSHIFSTLPTCYLATAERLGLIPQGLLPRSAWRSFFFPLEYATYLLPMLSASFACSLFLIVIGVFRIYSRTLR